MTDNAIKKSAERAGRPARIHPVRMQKIPSHLAGAAALEKACFSAPWSESSLELLTNEGIGVGYLTLDTHASDQDLVTAYGGMLITVDEGQITECIYLQEMMYLHFILSLGLLNQKNTNILSN